MADDADPIFNEDTNQPKHHTVVGSFRYGWGNGERRLLKVFGFFLFVMATVIGILVYNAVTVVVSPEPTSPYEITSPGAVTSRVDGVEGPATNDGQLLLLSEACNYTDGILVLDIQLRWSKFDGDVVVSTVEGNRFVARDVQPGGFLCGDSRRLPSQQEVPDEVQANPGTWQVSSQIIVSKCIETAIDAETGTETCAVPGPIIDTSAWFSQKFQVVEP